MKVGFGDFVFDADTRQLVGSRGEAHLTSKAFALLELLIERRPAVVTKEEIQAFLWPDTFVSEANLPSLVTEIRTALGDSARRPRFVRTVHRVGYAFCGDAAPVAARAGSATRARYSLFWEARRIPLFEGDNVVGRDRTATVSLESPGVSRQHCIISVKGAEVTVSDLGSKNGTYVHDKRITAPVPVTPGDRIRIGSLLLMLRLDREVSTETVSSHEQRNS